ncbi:MAG: hypothetical protein QMC93_03535, partial [Patescibacteria group bacterium]|nr:hypothetical protein [Patescibacteria group bacterium]
MPKFSKILISIFLALSLSAGFSISHFSQAKEANNPGNESFERNGVYICPQATSLEEVNPDCPGRIILKLGETKNGMTLGITEYEGKKYYVIYGFENGGAGVLEEEPRLETQIAITEMKYDDEDILEKVIKDVGDGVLPLLLSELKNASIDLEKYLPENKRKIYPNQKKKLKMRFKFLTTAGNEYQGKSIKVKFKFL